MKNLLPLFCGTLALACGARTTLSEREPVELRSADPLNTGHDLDNGASATMAQAPAINVPGGLTVYPPQTAPPTIASIVEAAPTPAGAITWQEDPEPVASTVAPVDNVPASTVPATTALGDPSNVPPAQSSPVASTGSACSNTESQGFALPEVGIIPGAQNVFSFSDSDSSHCPVPTTHCLELSDSATRFFGLAADAQSDYSCWGAGIGITMALIDDTGSDVEPWDAISLGITGLRVNVQGLGSGPHLRLGLAVAGFPEDATYVHKGGWYDIEENGEQPFKFIDFELPSWTMETYPELADVALDASKLTSVQFQVTTRPGSSSPFDLSLSGIEWFNDAQNPVAVTPLEPRTATDAGVR